MRSLMAGWLVAAAAAGACAGSSQDLMGGLQQSVEAYNRAFRWKNYPLAANYLLSDERADFLERFEEDDKNLHVEGFQVLSVHFESPELARVSVRYRYMMLPSVTLQQRVLTQQWAKMGEGWLLEREEPRLLPPRPKKDDGSQDPDAFGGQGPEEAGGRGPGSSR